MKIARCWNPACGFTMKGRWKNGGPERCPLCGWTKAQAEAAIKQTLAAKMEVKKDAA